MAENFIIPDETIISKIYQLRANSVMLDRDLAILFDVKAYRLREQVKRNKMRFPENFMFQLTENEVDVMVSQNAIPSKQYLGGHLPYVFTEHGVLQLSNVLKSERANQISIKIIELFVKMREMLLTHKDILLQLEEMRKSIKSNDERVDMIYNYLVQFINEQKKPRNEIGFKSNFQ
jgi:phage regulator Rha-like protein